VISLALLAIASSCSMNISLLMSGAFAKTFGEQGDRQGMEAHSFALGALGRINPGIARVVTPLRVGARDPDAVHLVLRQPQDAGDLSRAKGGFCEPFHSVAHPYLLEC
jgi:hypothetical protein